MKRKVYNLAIIGYGGMGSWHHESIKKNIEDIKVVSAWDVREEALEKAKKNGLRLYGGLEELLADKEIDIVTIATPNNFHRDISIECLKAGKNVICEKPVTMNADELRDIMSVSEQTGKLFSIHQNRRWDKDYQIIKRILKDNTIGKPYFIESRVQGSRRVMHGWRGNKENGGGMLLDWGVHIIDQVMELIDSPVVSVGAHFFNIYCKDVDDNIKVFLRFENGVSAVLDVSTNCLINHPRWHVSGTDGTAIVENWDCEGKIVCLKDDGAMKWEETIVYTSAGPTRTMAPRPEHTTVKIDLPEVEKESDWSNYYKNIVDVLRGKGELIVKPEQALRVMKVIDLLFECQQNGTVAKCRI